MHRIHKRTIDGKPADPADFDLLAEWLDHCPEQQCSFADFAGDGLKPLAEQTCGGKHPAAQREPYDPPRYVRPVVDGLW